MRLRYRWCYGVSKKREVKNSFYCGIPMSFLFSNNYAYFESLADTEDNGPLVAQYKQKLYSQAVRQANKAAKTISTGSEKVNQAVAFLGVAAESERNKEMAAVRAYKDKICSQLGNNQILLHKLESLFNGYNATDPQEFYEKLIYFFNHTRQEAVDLQERLETLKQEKRDKAEVYNRNFVFQNDSSSRTLIKRLSGHSRKKENATSYSKLIQDAALRVIAEKEYASRINLSDSTNLAALAVAIQNDLSHLFQREVYWQKLTGLDELTPERIYEITTEYINNTEESYTTLQKNLEHNKKQTENVLQSVKDTLGIKVKPLKKGDRSVRFTKETREWLKSIGLTPKQIREMGEVTVTCKSNTSAGNSFESIIILLQEGAGRKVKNSAAADGIMIGSIDITVETNDEIHTQLDKIITTVEKHAAKQDTRENIAASYREMNKTIDEAYQEMEKILKAIDSQEELFVYHESLKNYKSIESGENKVFHGREMKALTYLDELYAVQKGGGLTPPSIKYLEFLILNLFSGAVANQYKDVLEKYFSIFAGFLMFDDAVVMAQNAQRSMAIDNSKVKSVHLYNINGVYVPASYVLQSLYQALTEASNMIDMGIKVSFNDVGSEVMGIERDSTSPYPTRWREVSEEVQNKTKVNITFLSAFLQLIEQINSTYGV